MCMYLYLFEYSSKCKNVGYFAELCFMYHQSQNLVPCCIKKAPLLTYLYSTRTFSDICWPLTSPICMSFQFFPTAHFITTRKWWIITWKGWEATLNSIFSEDTHGKKYILHALFLLFYFLKPQQLLLNCWLANRI